MSHCVNVKYDKKGWVRLFFKTQEVIEENSGSNFCYIELSPEDKNYLIHLLKYEPKNYEE